MSTDKSGAPDSHRALIRSSSIVSAGTLSSRVLGFVRDIVLARFLGTAFRADAFFVALRIPNLFRDLVGEGTANSTVVPVLSEYSHTQSKKELWDFVNVVFCWSFIILSAITLIGMAFAPMIVRLIAPGFTPDPDKIQLTVNLTRIIFPYLILIGLTAYSMAILYTFRSFGTSAFSPCLFNLAIIASAIISTRTMTEPVYGLAWGVLVGGLLQLAVQIKPMMNLGLHLEKPRTLNHPGARKIGKLLMPRLVGSGVYQLNIFVDTFCASLSTIVGLGGISAIYYANRIIQFPIGIFSLALVSALLPTLSGLAAKKDTEAFRRTLTFSFQNILLVMIPATAFLMLLSQPIIRILFERGEFDSYSTHITSQALFFFSLGLTGFGSVKILVSAFHALQDTKTPVKVAALCLALNFILNLILMHPLKVGGIALASSISGTLNLVILYTLLKRKIGFDKSIKPFVAKVVFATAVMALAVWFLWKALLTWNAILSLVIVSVAGTLIFVAICYALAVPQIRSLYREITHSR